jgi:hypothetical protein
MIAEAARIPIRACGKFFSAASGRLTECVDSLDCENDGIEARRMHSGRC